MFNCCKPTFSPARTPESNRSSDNVEIKTLPDALEAEMYRNNNDLRILHRPTSPLGAGMSKDSGSSKAKLATSPPPARSLFEASAQRAASHSFTGRSGQPDIEHGGVPDKFLKAYVKALEDGNVTWAMAPAFADMFAEDAKMTGQDKKTTVGKGRVLQRLNQGVEMLLQMAGENAAPPAWDISGPTLTDETFHQYKCTIKRGVMKFSFVLEFLIVGGKIKHLRNART